MSSHRWRRVVDLSFVALTVLACSETTSPEELTCPAVAVPLCLQSDSTSALLRPVTNDAATRSTGALGNAAAKTNLTTELNALAEAISRGNVTLARQAIVRARAALQTARSQLDVHPGDAPDLTAIELALIQAERAVQ